MSNKPMPESQLLLRYELFKAADGLASRLWSVHLTRENCPGFTISWIHCTCRVLPLTLGKPAAPHENFTHRLNYVRQRRND